MDSKKAKRQVGIEDEKAANGFGDNHSQSKKNEMNTAIPADPIVAEKDEVKNAEARLRNKNKPSK